LHRRSIIKAGLLSSASVSIPGLLSWPKRARAANVQYDVVAERVVRVPVAGLKQVIAFWQFTDQNTGSPLAIEALSGDLVTINLTNTLAVSVSLEIPGLLNNATVCEPGQSQVYSFSAPVQPGSYLYFDAINDTLGRAMGLSGSVVVRAQDGSNTFFEGLPPFQREHVLLMQEIDSRLNDAVDSGLSYDFLNYEPDYFFVNRLLYLGGEGVKLTLGLGENVAIRFINAGLIYYPMHFHGYHVSIVSRNRSQVSDIIEKDTVSVRPGEVVDTLLAVGQQAGLYPLHSHYVPAVTNNGVYPGGGLIMMNAS